MLTGGTVKFRLPPCQIVQRQQSLPWGRPAFHILGTSFLRGSVFQGILRQRLFITKLRYPVLTRRIQAGCSLPLQHSAMNRQQQQPAMAQPSESSPLTESVQESPSLPGITDSRPHQMGNPPSGRFHQNNTPRQYSEKNSRQFKQQKAHSQKNTANASEHGHRQHIKKNLTITST